MYLLNETFLDISSGYGIIYFRIDLKFKHILTLHLYKGFNDRV
jgi:hypothetical protein